MPDKCLNQTLFSLLFHYGKSKILLKSKNYCITNESHDQNSNHFMHTCTYSALLGLSSDSTTMACCIPGAKSPTPTKSLKMTACRQC